MTSTILVTGGAGYIGSHACKALAQAGYLPVTFDNLSRGHAEAVKWGPLERGDLLDADATEKALSKYHPSAVLHFAGFAYVGESMSDPGRYYRNNVGGSVNLLAAMARHGVKIIVFSSTCATYGLPTQIPIGEDHSQNPINPYGASKLMIERILRDFDAAHGIKSASLRYFNAAGADPDGEIGEDHDPEPHLIPLALATALGRRPALDIFGDDYDTPDGTCIRDYIHVSDLAEAHVLALKYLESNKNSVALNLGTGQGHSVREVISTAEKVIGRKITTRISPRRPGDPPRLIADATRARQILGWKPKWESLETIIRHAWTWQQSHTGRNRAS